ncbi:MAG: ABC transporter ATP-binding protein [Pseudomonadota bacterium]
MTASDALERITPAIEVAGLRFRYAGAQRDALRDISFTVAPGEIFGLLGPSGAGKSTLQRLLTRQLPISAAGTVRCLGRDLDAWDHHYFNEIGVGFEAPNHYPRLSGRENLRFFQALHGRDDEGAVAAALEEVGLGHAADQPVGAYSKGMAMRLNFARATLHDPQLLFLDEPTSGLDPVSAGRVKRLIARRRDAGATVILTTHAMLDVEELRDRVGFILNGAMTVVDRVDALKARFGARSVEVTYGSGQGAGAETARFALDGLADDPAFHALLRDRDIRAIHSQEASLNQVFERLTGVDLSQEEGG